MNTTPHRRDKEASVALRHISLALQGGGSHGAFTWGVLDTLLQDERIVIDGISGTSAGAVNAVALAQGFISRLNITAGNSPPDTAAVVETDREVARQTLAQLWKGIETIGSLGTMAQGVMRLFFGGLDPGALGGGLRGGSMSRWISPYQVNPLDINPLRKLLDDLIDFEALGQLKTPKLFASATHVRTGQAAIFSGKRLTLAAVMASACLPTVFQAVEIDGEHYWDGGFSANPSLTPLIDACESRDIVLVQINPLKHADTPRGPQEITDRVNELTFNASLLSQMRGIDFINRMIETGQLEESAKYKQLRLHRIDGGKAMEEWPASSKMSTDGAMIAKLFELGQTSAQQWLARNLDALGQKSSIDIRRDYVSRMR